MEKKPLQRLQSPAPRGAAVNSVGKLQPDNFIRKDLHNTKFTRGYGKDIPSAAGDSRSSAGQARNNLSFHKCPSAKVLAPSNQRQLGRVTEAQLAEAGSAYRPGSKKGNGNLHNFYDDDDILDMMPTTGRASKQHFHRKPDYYHHQLAGISHHAPPCSKDQFLLANCQFLLSDGLELDEHSFAFNADAMIPWDNVEELRIVEESELSCPICLYPPIAAKITRCGHVFCWPCILHYLSLSDKDWRKCPICFESVNKSHLKSVKIIAAKHCAVGDQITMQLLRRPRASVVALPASKSASHYSDLLSAEDEHGKYAKFLRVTPEEILQTIVMREKEEMEIQLALEGEEPEAVFLHEGFAYLIEREAHLKSLIASHQPKRFRSKIRSCGDSATQINGEQNQTPPEKPNEDVKELSITSDQPEAAAAAKDCTTTTDQLQLAQQHLEADKYFYFYQAVDGRHIYLHSFNARCISHEYGALHNGPEFVGGQVLEVERHVMSEELRRRFRYLAHLPLNTSFALVELRVDRTVISNETLDVFRGEFLKRQQARRRRQSLEKRHDVTAKRLETALLLDPANYTKYVSSPTLEIPITKIVRSGEAEIKLALSTASRDELSQSPPSAGAVAYSIAFDDAAYPELGCQPVLQQAAPALSAATQACAVASTATPAVTTVNEAPAVCSPSETKSFAEMLRLGTGRQRSSPSMSEFATASSCANSAAAVSSLLPETTYADAIGEALEAALASANLEAAAEGEGGGKKSAKKGKSSRKGRILFSM